MHTYSIKTFFIALTLFFCNTFFSFAKYQSAYKRIPVYSEREFIDLLNKMSVDEINFNDTIVLNTDIDAGDLKDYEFYGCLKGNNHKILNLKKALFSNNYGVIDSLIIDESFIIKTASTGAFCINNYGTIINCTNNASIQVFAFDSEMVGGICAYNINGNIINCTNKGIIKTSYDESVNVPIRTGGISGRSEGTIVSCCNKGEINTTSTYISLSGGICGDMQGGKVINCNNEGDVISNLKYPGNSRSLQDTGGIVGLSQGWGKANTINRCTNYGKISNNFEFIGGIAGKVSDTNLYNLINYGEIMSLYDNGYSCAAGIVAKAEGVNYKFQFYNCINHGNISSSAKYATATAAGISATIINSYVANMYNDAPVSAQRVGGSATSDFEIKLYETDSKSTILSSVENCDEANDFIMSYKDSKETLLAWNKDVDKFNFISKFFTYAIPQHGCVDLYMFDNNQNNEYLCEIFNNNNQKISSSKGYNKIRIGHLFPNEQFQYFVYDSFSDYSEKGSFKTLDPQISFSVVNVSYDNITFNHSCNVNGVDDMYANIIIKNTPSTQQILYSVNSSDNSTVSGLEEDSMYIASITYFLNGKQFVSKDLLVSTQPISAELSQVDATPYSLIIKCDNIKDIKAYSPKLFFPKLHKYSFGGYYEENNFYCDINEDGLYELNGLLYNYKPNDIFLSYIFNGEERFRKIEDPKFKTTNFGGEGIIQLSKNAAMVHALFGGMGGSVDYKRYYDRARFYYMDAFDIGSGTNLYVDGICIDNAYDYAVTIPINSELYQYYISVQASCYIDPKNNSINGNWNIIDTQMANVDEVEPRFYGASYRDNTLFCSIIKGEKDIHKRWIEYKIEGYESTKIINLPDKNDSERASYKSTSFAPQLTYNIVFCVENVDGKIYKSPIYKLNNNNIELVQDKPNSIQPYVYPNSTIRVSTFNRTIQVDNCEQDKIKTLYNIRGEQLYKGYDSIINVQNAGIYILKIGSKSYKISI